MKFLLFSEHHHSVVVADLSAVIVEDAHEADGHRLVDGAAQSLSGEGKHKGDVLLATSVDDSVERFIQASCRGRTSCR